MGIHRGHGVAAAVGLLSGVLLAAAPSAEAAWWRRSEPVSYGLRFVDPRTNAPVTAPLARLRVGERHLIHVALYAARDGELDESRQLDAGPRGPVTVQLDSADPRVLGVEPARSAIRAGYNRAVAEFWLVGKEPGEARVTATAELGDDAAASTWFGPVSVRAAPAPAPKRLELKPPPKPEARAEDLEDDAPAVADGEDESAAPEAEADTVPPVDTAEPPVSEELKSVDESPAPVMQPEAEAPADDSPPPAPEPPLALATSQPDTSSSSDSEELDAVPPAEQPSSAAPPSPAGSAVAPKLQPGPMPPSIPAPQPNLFAEDAPAPVSPAPDAAVAEPEQEAIEPPREPVEVRKPTGGSFAVDDLPEDPNLYARSAAEAEAIAQPAPGPDQPCIRFSALTIRNVSALPLRVNVRDAGGGLPMSERLAPGDELHVTPEQGGTVWIDAERHDGEREGLRLVAETARATDSYTVPAFGAEPWLAVRTAIVSCPRAHGP